jgi:endonuclease YncB( thermonuclease family)
MAFMNQHKGRPYRLPRRRGRRPGGRGSVVTLLILLAAALYAWWTGRPEYLEGRVLHVQDGDSFIMMKDGEEQTVRLYAVDAPERDQPFGAEAKAFVRDQVENRPVRLMVRNEDRYGRLIADVYDEDERCLNHTLVSAGYAWWYRHHASRDRTLARLEQEAREARRGLWQDDNPIPPWEFRNR